MGINIKGSGKKKSPKKETDPKEKLDRDLKSCMQCKFFYGNNNRCIKNKECSGRITDEQKAAQEEKKKVNVMDVHMEETVHIVFRA